MARLDAAHQSIFTVDAVDQGNEDASTTSFTNPFWQAIELMTSDTDSQATSTELTGGAGFSYEDTVVAYYLTALLLEGHAAGLPGVVQSVAVQQAADQPMDDIIVEINDVEGRRVLALQVKRSLRISAAASNTDFLEVMSASVATRKSPQFQPGRDAYGVITEHVAVAPFRALSRLIEWARASPCGADFARRFEAGGTAATAECRLRQTLYPLTGATTEDAEADFYRDLVARKIDGLDEGGVTRAGLVTQLQEMLVENGAGQEDLLFDRLCRIARDGAGHARKWTRTTLLQQLRGVARLRIAPSYAHDLDIIHRFSREGLADVSDSIDDFHVERPALQEAIGKRLAQCRLVNITGLPGCGKSAALKQYASSAATLGPILFLKSDRLLASSWSAFASTLGLRHSPEELLGEIGVTGTPVLFIDGIDRVRPDQKGVITDLLRVIESHQALSCWKVLASSRDQGLEPYRAWFPASFYRDNGIGDVTAGPFTDDEAAVLAIAKPHLRPLLIDAPAVRDIARRPFFAAVLAGGWSPGGASPQSEIDLISEWWSRAGHDAGQPAAQLRKRALIDLAESGVRNLGKNISVRHLKEGTIAQIEALKTDLIIREQDGGASFSFTHDIFFEWAFFRLLIELSPDWQVALSNAGEAPLLGRVIALLAQNALATPGKWTEGYRALEGQSLRPQWRREWLTAPPFTSAFNKNESKVEFAALLRENDFILLEKLLVWYQAQHTIPNPVVLQRPDEAGEGVEKIRVAHLVGWPSDVRSWGRLLDWLLPLAPSLPVRLVPHVLEVFSVWQNMWANLQNARSAALVQQCSSWLLQMERSEHLEPADEVGLQWQALRGEASSSLASSLRYTILRSARTYPEPAVALLARAAVDADVREAAYNDLMAFAPMLSEIAPEAVVAVTKAALMEELPQDRFERQQQEDDVHLQRLKKLRAIPEAERTPHERNELNSAFFPIGQDRYSLDDIGINRHHRYYMDPSARHEPFASLFDHAPACALQLVRDVSNHAVTGWRQIYALNRRTMGTPLPVLVEFPWGTQSFWGDWHVYSWSQGQLAAAPLECAYLALSYWAFQVIDQGRPAGEVIKLILEGGSECYASLGLALVLALETLEVSDVTLALVTCQKLWGHDIARVVHGPSKDIDILGLGFLSRLSGAKALAKAFLDKRESRLRNVHQLAMSFALSRDEHLRAQFKAAIEAFPSNLPYEIVELRDDSGETEHLEGQARRWAGLGDIKNYRQTATSDNGVMVTYQSPVPLAPKQQKRLEEATAFLQAQWALGWATQSLSENAPRADWDIANAVAFAKAHDSDLMFAVRSDVGGHAEQSAISAIAACVIRFDSTASNSQEWAWAVLARVEGMDEPESYPGARISWHPTNHLIVALVHLRRSRMANDDSAARLLKLTMHPLDDVAHFAFRGLLTDADEHVRWVTAQLAMDLSIYWGPTYSARGGQDNSRNQLVREEGLARALVRLATPTATPFIDVPPAWTESTSRRTDDEQWDDEESWQDSTPSFDAEFAAKIVPLFPIEEWCQPGCYRAHWQNTLEQFVSWTADRLMPPWIKEKARRSHQSEIYKWQSALGDLLARTAPWLEIEWVRQKCVEPFLSDDDKALSVLSRFTDRTVCRHVMDSLDVPKNVLDLLELCVERVISDPTFIRGRYRAGKVYGNDLPVLIEALLFVSVENAPDAKRFANGDWSQIDMVMPLVTKLVSAVGWSAYVMDKFLTLCERADAAYPLDSFILQVNAALVKLASAEASWIGTTLAARMAGVVQRLADNNFPLHTEQAQGLLRILDTLIDLGDRRSAALEQTEAFRGIQGH